MGKKRIKDEEDEQGDSYEDPEEDGGTSGEDT